MPFLNYENYTIDTHYPVYSITGYAGDGCMMVMNTDTNKFYFMFDGWDKGHDQFLFKCDIWDENTQSVKETITVDYFDHTYYSGQLVNDYHFKFIGAKYDPRVPNVNLKFIKNCTFDNPMGDALWFTVSAQSYGWLDGPYRIYDNVYSRWTGLLIYYFTDNGYDGGPWSSGPIGIRFGINGSGKPPQGGYNTNLSRVKYLKLGNNGYDSDTLWRGLHGYDNDLMANYVRDLMGPEIYVLPSTINPF